MTYNYLITMFTRYFQTYKPLGRWGYHFEKSILYQKYYD